MENASHLVLLLRAPLDISTWTHKRTMKFTLFYLQCVWAGLDHTPSPQPTHSVRGLVTPSFQMWRLRLGSEMPSIVGPLWACGLGVNELYRTS